MTERGFQAVVRGRVQGVGFRMFVRHEALRLGLCGYTRNLPDGTVEVVATGKVPDLERFVARLRAGPPGARVDAVEIHPDPGLPVSSHFEVRA